jgi:HlyD family secretion protein
MTTSKSDKTSAVRKRRRIPWVLFVIVLVLAGAAWGWQYRASRSASSVEFETAALFKGDVSSHVSATGTLDAVTKIEVGSEVSGIVSQLYVDYNSVVSRGQALAQLDPSSFKTQIDQSTASVNNAIAQYNNQIANLANQEANIRSQDATVAGAGAKVETANAAVSNAEASVRTAEANAQKAKADLDQALTNYKRYEVLVSKDLVAKSDRDTAYTQYLDAKANAAGAKASVDAARAGLRSTLASLSSARTDVEAARMRRDSAVAQRDAAAAQVKSAQAGVSQARASLEQARVNLAKTTIRSPIRGIVLDRKVTIGQTVAAQFQAPDLFTLAENLDQMQVATNVDEADIGRVAKGAHVSFTVDAYPNVKFEGSVTEVRQAPVTVQNVVTYVVVVSAKNPDHKLKPGMTATVSIDVETRKDVLLIPNSALRFKPADSEMKERERPEASGSPGPRRHHRGQPSGAPSGLPHESDTTVSHKPVRVWVVDASDPTKVIPKRIVLGITDGTNTEVVRAPLKEGDKVVTGSNGEGGSQGNKRRMRFF